MTFLTQYTEYRDRVNAALLAVMDSSKAPQPLLDAMRYSLLAGGKRIRPVLLLGACDAADGDGTHAMPYACALEMIHAYSLIHDDLPAIDDDDLRRGQPTNHKVYGEGMAILAGDGLLSLAFETMLAAARQPTDIAAMHAIARAAGVEGMVAGQCIDITRDAASADGEDAVVYIHRHKTADLFIGAVAAGLSLADAPPEWVNAGIRYAYMLGTAFQIRDDLLDIEGDAQALGKATGMDASHQKLTWPGVFGIEAARKALQENTQAAMQALLPLGEHASFLRDAADYLLTRNR